MNSRRLLSALALAAGFGLSSACFADITGTVKFEGEAPEPAQIDMSAVKECAAQHPDGAFDESLVAADGKLANVVVSVKADNLQGEVPKEAAVLDQKGCQYLPHVLPVMVGQKIVIKNSDTFLHNVNGKPNENVPFNIAQPNVAETPIEPLKTPEAFRVKCDVHPWMSAYIVGVENPYFATSGDDGTFTINGKLPPGEYTLRAWHERLGTQEIPVKVEAGTPAEVQVKFAAP